MPTEPTISNITCPDLKTLPCCQLPKSCPSIQLLKSNLAVFIQLIVLVSATALAIFSIYNSTQATSLIKGATLLVPICIFATVITCGLALFFLYLYVERFEKNRWITIALEALALMAFVISLSFLSYATYTTSHIAAIIGLLVSCLSLPIIVTMAYIHYYNHPTQHLDDLLRINREQRNEHIYVTMPTMHVHNGSSEHIYETIPITMETLV